MKPVFISLIYLLLAFNTFAQKNNKTSDIVLLKNGDRLSGEITEYIQGEKLILKRSDDTEITILAEEIQQIIQELADENENALPAEDFKPKSNAYIKPKTNGLYNITQLSFAMGSGSEPGLALGAGISTIVGYQLKPILGLGLGIGLDNYARRGETIYPVFVDVRSYLPISKKPHSYYISLAGGYGFAFARESIGINSAKGGYMAHAAIGYRTTTKEGVDVNVDIGVKNQKATFSRDLFNGDIERRDLTFQRLIVRVGIALWSKK
ncbi:MAG: hypothetical protein R2825_28415 [Saprospiraceae bacterium]